MALQKSAPRGSKVLSKVLVFRSAIVVKNATVYGIGESGNFLSPPTIAYPIMVTIVLYASFFSKLRLTPTAFEVRPRKRQCFLKHLRFPGWTSIGVGVSLSFKKRRALFGHNNIELKKTIRTLRRSIDERKAGDAAPNRGCVKNRLMRKK